MIRKLKDDQLRRSDFKIGTFHGKQLPGKDSRECKIQREVYLVGNLRMNLSRTCRRDVRIIAYEVPLGKKSRRIDLIGYDDAFNIFLIEVKRKDNRETLHEKVVAQIDEYAEVFHKIRKDFEKEFSTIFFFRPRFRNIIKVVLAPREYYRQNGGENELFATRRNGDVLFGYFGRIPKDGEKDLVKSSRNRVEVNFHNGKSWPAIAR